jgi:hypothetical protein
MVSGIILDGPWEDVKSEFVVGVDVFFFGVVVCVVKLIKMVSI